MDEWDNVVPLNVQLPFHLKEKTLPCSGNFSWFKLNCAFAAAET
jgi:hypothetical protein